MYKIYLMIVPNKTEHETSCCKALGDKNSLGADKNLPEYFSLAQTCRMYKARALGTF